MNYQDDFRQKELVQGLAERLHRLVSGCGRTMNFMEVCGTHTMAIYRFGLRALLPPEIKLVSGPGCPVCVTPNSYLDRAIAISRLPDVITTTFGDMMRVPGSSSSLLVERAKGADIRIVYSPLDAVAIAAKNRDKRVVFLGVGFETTAPTIAGSILAAQAQELSNYFVLAANKTIPIPMQVLASDPEIGIDGYICPAHVSAIIGADAYKPLAGQYHTPCVITGFEPADMLQGILMLASQLLAGESKVEIQYSRVVRPEGNPKAQAILAQMFTPCDVPWRGIGVIPGSGLAIREEYSAFDAEKMLPVEVEPTKEHPGCSCGEILKGKMAPRECALFGKLCTPENPVGACMVSSEGSCAAAFRYGE
jgi:hydrogenase expression/formation protein HypD